MNKAVVGVVAAVAVVGSFIGYKVLSLRSEAAKWSGPMKEVAEEGRRHDNHMNTDSRVPNLAAPIDHA